MILSALFPITQGYMVTPHRRCPDHPESHFPIIEVVKMTTMTPLKFHCVLIVEIKSSQDWESGIPALQCQLNQQADAAFAGTTHSKVYWIGVIGPHWRYGEKEDDGQDARPLIGWHDATHDQASFDDLQTLKHLVSAL